MKTLIAENLNYLCEKNGLSSYKLAQLMEISPKTINKIRNKESEEKLYLETIIRFSQHFKISIDDLLFKRLEEC